MKFSADWFSYNIQGVTHALNMLQNKNKFDEILFTNQIGIMKK